MRIALFCHSLRSDWNHGNAHFLRGVVRELGALGQEVEVYEPADGWSVSNLLAEEGPEALDEVARAFPWMAPRLYEPAAIRESEGFDAWLETVLEGADLVLVHEWTDPELVAAAGRVRRRGDFRLLFHDTHHRSISAPEEMAALDLSGYDGVLAFGEVIRRRYLERGWAERAWTWHEAADTEVFRPLPSFDREEADLVWIGNWGDDERTAELEEFLVGPVRRLGLSATVHGVRYPDTARASLAEAGIDFRGRVANHRVPEVFARHRLTVHVPRRPYAEALPGIPTIRPFEAMACGIPLVSAPWNDAEGLFRRGSDHLVARDGTEMARLLRELLADAARRREMAREGLATVRARHTCRHRAEELLAIAGELAGAREREEMTA